MKELIEKFDEQKFDKPPKRKKKKKLYRCMQLYLNPTRLRFILDQNI